MNKIEKDIIDRAVKNAMVFGLGHVTAARQEITDNGFIFTDAHTQYIFDTYTSKQYGV